MQKTAQKRDIFEKMKEKLSPSGQFAESFFNPEFKRVMESLRESDNKIRAIAVGKDVEGQDPGADAISLKDLLKSAHSNINRREYMSAVSDLARFHNKMSEIMEVIKKLNLNVDKVHHEFLFKDLGDEQKQHLINLHKKFAAQEVSIASEMVKRASIMDFLHNIGTKPGRARAAWEKRYPKQVGKLKKETSSLLSASQKLFEVLLSSLKEMSSARNGRNVDNYMKSASRIQGVFDKYEAGFKQYYQDNVKGFLMQTDFLPKPETAPAVKVEDSKELGKQEVVGPRGTIPAPPSKEVVDLTKPKVPSLPPQAVTPAKPAVPSLPPTPGATTPYEQIMGPGAAALKAPAVPKIEGDEPLPEPEKGISSTPPPIPTTGRQAIMPPPLAHNNFYETLEAMSGETPLLLASFIRKYATKIQESDPETSINLFKIAKSIKV